MATATAVALTVDFAAAVVHAAVVVVLFSLREVTAVVSFLMRLLCFLVVEVRLVAGSLALAQLAVGFSTVDAVLLVVVALVNFVDTGVTRNVGRFGCAWCRFLRHCK